LWYFPHIVLCSFNRINLIIQFSGDARSFLSPDTGWGNGFGSRCDYLFGAFTNLATDIGHNYRQLSATRILAKSHCDLPGSLTGSNRPSGWNSPNIVLSIRHFRYPVFRTLRTFTYREGAVDLTRHNRIFGIEIYQDTLVVLPLGDSQAFYFKDIQIEASRVMDVIKFQKVRHVVIDFNRAEVAGHILVESLTSFCKAVPGKSALCGANAKTFQMLRSSPLLRLWDHYASRQDALQAVHLPD
jgi:hypothetical protein